MTKGTGKAYPCWRIGVVAAFLASFALCGALKAENVVTANLSVTPSPLAKPGAVVKFQADVFYNPDFDEPAGTRMRIFVTRSDFSWVSDKLDIEYPGMGSVHVNFNNGFTVPANAPAGQVFDFYLVYGPWWPLSGKASVKVVVIKKKLVKMPLQAVTKK